MVRTQFFVNSYTTIQKNLCLHIHDKALVRHLPNNERNMLLEELQADLGVYRNFWLQISQELWIFWSCMKKMYICISVNRSLRSGVDTKLTFLSGLAGGRWNTDRRNFRRRRI